MDEDKKAQFLILYLRNTLVEVTTPKIFGLQINTQHKKFQKP